MRRLSAAIPAVLVYLSLASAAHAIALPANTVFVTPASSATTYTEIGDAGDHFSPQPITGTGIDTIVGDIGGPADPTDAFSFFFPGGGVAFLGVVSLADGGPAVLIPLPLTLFPGLGHPPEPIKPDLIIDGGIGFLGLAAGDYIIEGTFLADPPFSIGVFTLESDGTLGAPRLILPPRAVPAPASAVLLTLGLVGLWRASRRLRPR